MSIHPASDDGGPRPEQSITIRSNEELGEIFQEKGYASTIRDVQKYIECRYRKYGIPAGYDTDDLLSTTCLRVIGQLEKKGEIPNLFGCFKRTAHNVMREVGKRHKKEKALFELLAADPTEQEEANLLDDISQPDSYSILFALQTLSKIEQRICFHRFVSELAWREVCQELANEGLLCSQTCTTATTINTISRCGRRALQKLKRKYSQYSVPDG